MRLMLTCGRSAVIALLIASSWNAADAREAAPSEHAPSAAAEQKSFDEFVERLAAQWMRADPVSASAQQYFSGPEQAALDRQLTAKDFSYGIPLGKAARTEYVQRLRRALEQLKTLPRAQLTPVERTSAASLEWQLRDSLRMANLEERRYVFEQFGGLHVSLINFLSQAHPLRNAPDVANYLARLSQLAPVLDEGIAAAKSRAQQGVIPPKFILQATLDGIDRFLQPAPQDNVLVTSLVDRTGKISGLTEAQRATARENAVKLVREAIIPAVGRIRTLLSAQLAVATDEAGIRNLPDGTSPYAAFLQSNTTTDMTPEQVHALGLQQVAQVGTKGSEGAPGATRGGVVPRAASRG